MIAGHINESMVIESFQKETFNDSMINERGRRAYGTAEELVKRFGNPNGFKFYYKVAYYLSEATIWKLVDYILGNPKITHKANYFSKCANRELQKVGF